MGAQGQGLSCAKRPRTREMVGLTELDPILPEDGDADYNKWIKSEQVALGLIIGTATEIHFEVCHAFERAQPGVYGAQLRICIWCRAPV